MQQSNEQFSTQLNGKYYIPSKCVCIGRNYVGHIQEMGSQPTQSAIIFNKPSSAIGSELYARHNNETVQFETELCFLMIAGEAKGVGLGLDLTKRATQRELKRLGLPWEKSKAFNNSAVFSPFIIAPPTFDDLRFSLSVDDCIQQKGAVADMIFSPQVIFDQINAFESLYDGDIVMTGTPEGVADLVSGMTYRVSLFNAGQLLLSHSWKAQ